MIIFFSRVRVGIFKFFRIKRLDFRYFVCTRIIASKLIKHPVLQVLWEVRRTHYWQGLSIATVRCRYYFQKWLEPALSTEVLKRFLYSAIQAKAYNGIRLAVSQNTEFCGIVFWYMYRYNCILPPQPPTSTTHDEIICFIKHVSQQISPWVTSLSSAIEKLDPGLTPWIYF